MKKNLSVLLLLFLLGLIVSCGDDDMDSSGDEDNDEETITQVELTFTPSTGSLDEVTATWYDADGDGIGAPEIDGIELIEGEEYTLTMEFTNTLTDPDEDITAEIRDEDDEHQLFFAFTDGIFSDPTGDGNVDNASDPINYEDEDSEDQDGSGNPIGLTTTWTAGSHTETTGEFNIILKHQPDLKTSTSDATVGGTDFDITFPIDIVEDPNEEEEVINQVVLTFTPTDGGEDIRATWLDADGEGVGNPTIDDINLDADTEYEMSIALANTLVDPAEDITEEIEDEDDEHQFFFEFTADIFASPSGDGNVDNASDPLNYEDEDSDSQDGSGLPVGLQTSWETGGVTSGTLRIILKHQPGVKSATSTSEDGGTDIDIEFSINIE